MPETVWLNILKRRLGETTFILFRLPIHACLTIGLQIATFWKRKEKKAFPGKYCFTIFTNAHTQLTEDGVQLTAITAGSKK